MHIGAVSLIVLKDLNSGILVFFLNHIFFFESKSQVTRLLPLNQLPPVLDEVRIQFVILCCRQFSVSTQTKSLEIHEAR